MSPAEPGRTDAAWTGVALVIGTLTIAAVAAALGRIEPIQNANDESRWCTVWSLVERGTYVIDDAPWTAHTVDKIRRDGHFYSSKPPLFPTMVAGGYAALRALTGWRLETHPHLVVRTLLALVNVAPLGLFLWLYAQFVAARTASLFDRTLCLAAAALGTFVTSYAVTLNNHTPAALVCFFVIYAVQRLSAETDGCTPLSPRPRRTSALFAAAGGLAGLLPALDFLAVPFCVCVFAWLLRLDPRRCLTAFVPAALVPIAGFFITNWLVMDGLLPAYAFKFTELYRYPGSFWENPRGIAANHDSTATYLFHMMLGHHGWFSHTPLFIPLAASMVVRWRRGPAGLPAFNLFVIANFAAVALFHLYNGSRDYGGTCQGLRWLFWMIPLWLAALPGELPALTRTPAARAGMLAALALSAFSALYALPAPWGTSWLHQGFRWTGWISY